MWSITLGAIWVLKADLAAESKPARDRARILKDAFSRGFSPGPSTRFLRGLPRVVFEVFLSGGLQLPNNLMTRSQKIRDQASLAIPARSQMNFGGWPNKIALYENRYPLIRS